MRKVLWRTAQVAVFLVLVYWISLYRGQETLLAVSLIALGLTALIFTPLIYLEMWLRARKQRIDARSS